MNTDRGVGRQRLHRTATLSDQKQTPINMSDRPHAPIYPYGQEESRGDKKDKQTELLTRGHEGSHHVPGGEVSAARQQHGCRQQRDHHVALVFDVPGTKQQKPLAMQGKAPDKRMMDVNIHVQGAAAAGGGGDHPQQRIKGARNEF